MFDIVLLQPVSSLHYSFIFTLAFFSREAFSSECNYTKAILVDDMCVIYDSARTTWFKAVETCANYGMHLVTIQSAEQIGRMLKVLPPNITLEAWTGGNDLDVEGMFVWEENQKPVVESVWRVGEPNHYGDEDCTFINPARKLSDVKCNDKGFALCMYRLPTPANYFGENVTYVCHCKEGPCDTTGYCYNSSGRCATGWFGPGCQFRSLSGDKYGPLGVLADNDETTCTSGIQRPVTIKMKSGRFFTWIRIIVDKSEQLIGGFEIYFNVNQMKVLCQGMKELSSGDRSLDIVCHDGPFVVDDVILNWQGQKNICSVYVNGEQNFALLQKATVPGQSNASIALPVDGRRSPTDQCFEGLPKQGKQNWVLTFDKPKVIDEIIIHRKPKAQKYASMNGFYVQGYNEEDKLLFRYNDTGQNANKSSVWIITEVRMPMKKFIISMDQATDQRHLELCEVEAFGTCAPPDYGLNCDQTCDPKCLDGECHHNGECVNCGYGLDDNGTCLESKLNVLTTMSTIQVPMNTTVTENTTALSCQMSTQKPPPVVDDNSWLIRLLILTTLLLVVLEVLLILYILKNKKDKGEQPPPVEDKGPVDEPEVKDLAATKSSHSHHTATTERETTVAPDKSAITIKSTRTESTHIA